MKDVIRIVVLVAILYLIYIQLRLNEGFEDLPKPDPCSHYKAGSINKTICEIGFWTKVAMVIVVILFVLIIGFAFMASPTFRGMFSVIR